MTPHGNQFRTVVAFSGPLRERIADECRRRETSLAQWLREAALQRLERDALSSEPSTGRDNTESA